MKLRRIEVRNFRALEGDTVIDNLGDGLTVVAGENEEGKSTLLDALRTVLFERHKVTGQAAERFLPFGSKVRPEIRLDFSLNGAAYSLFKAFCQQPEARLETPDGVYTNDDAEAELQRLLQTRAPTRGASKPEHRGVWGMLWVEQGRGFEALEVPTPARKTLQATLQREVGEVLGGERGSAILESVREQKSGLLDKRDLPRGDYRKQLARVKALGEELQEVHAELTNYDQQVDALGAALDERSQLVQSGAIERARQAFERATNDLRTLDTLERAAEQAEQKLALSKLSHEQQHTLKKQRDQLKERAERLSKAAAAATTQAKHASGELQPSEAQWQVFSQTLIAMRETLSASRRDVAVATQAAELANKHAKRKTVQRRLRAAKKQAKIRDAAFAAAQEIAVTEQNLELIRAANARIETARARLEASTTKVTIRFEDHAVSANAMRVAPHEPVELRRPTTLEIEGVGVLEVAPGAQSLEDLEKQLHEAEAALNELLAATNMPDVNAAARAYAERQRLNAEALAAQQALHFDAPNGVDALQAEVQALQSDLDALSEATTGRETALGAREAELVLRQCTAARERHEGALLETEAQLDALREARETKHRVVVDAEARAKALHEEAEATANELEVARDAVADATLLKAFSDAANELHATREAAIATQAALAAANPKERRQRHDEAHRELRQLEQRLQHLETSSRELRIHLAASGQAGLGERSAELAAELERATAILQKFERDAEALRLLERILEQEEAAAKREFLEPVQKRIHPYLQTLIPDAQLAIDSDLQIRGLRRDGSDEPFEALSVGTREQLAVLTRLAFADILSDDGMPAPLLLDDALVYSDDERFSRMKEILGKAAHKQQVLILTCRERDWRDLRAPLIRLSECRDRRRDQVAAPER